MEADVSVRVCSWTLCGIQPDPAESRKIRRGQAIPRWFSGGGTRGTMRDRGIPATRNFLPDIGPGSRRIRVGPECSPPLRIGEASPLSVKGIPVGMRDARHAAAGIVQLASPILRDTRRIRRFPNPHSTKGCRTPSSSAARAPGRQSPESSTLAPSSRVRNPFSAAARRISVKRYFLQW